MPAQCHLSFVAHEDGYRRTVEIPLLAYLVLKEATVGLLDPLREIAEEDKRRDNSLLQHRDVFYLHKLTLVARRGRHGYLLEHIGVELRCGDHPAAVLIDLDRGLEHFEDPLLCEGRGEENREVGKGGEFTTYGLLEMLLSRHRLILHEIPFIYADHEPLPVALYETEDIGVLALDAARRVDHEDADVAGLNGADGTDHAVILDILVDLLLLADTRGVDEIEIEAELVVAVIYGVARSAGDIGDDVALLPNEGIDERRFPGVGSSHYGELGDVLLGLLAAVWLGHVGYDLVKELTRAAAVGRRHLDRVAETQGIELRNIEAGIADILFVCHQDHRLAATPQDGGHLIIEVGHSVGGIDHEKDNVSFLYGYLHLLVDLALEDILRVDHPSAGVDDRELLPTPVDHAILAVARGAGRVVDYGLARLRQTVEQG